MTKKFLAVFLLSFTLLIVGQSSNAEAGEAYVGTYSDGTPAYLLTHTIAGGRGNFACTVRANALC